MQRVVWFMDFNKCLYGSLLDNPKYTLKKSSQLAYDTALAPNHSLKLRMLVKVAFIGIPHKSVLSNKVFGI